MLYNIVVPSESDTGDTSLQKQTPLTMTARQCVEELLTVIKNKFDKESLTKACEQAKKKVEQAETLTSKVEEISQIVVKIDAKNPIGKCEQACTYAV